MFFFINILGRGVRAEAPIKGGEMLVEYVGELISGIDGNRREELTSSVFRYFFDHKRKKYW